MRDLSELHLGLRVFPIEHFAAASPLAVLEILGLAEQGAVGTRFVWGPQRFTPTAETGRAPNRAAGQNLENFKTGRPSNALASGIALRSKNQSELLGGEMTVWYKRGMNFSFNIAKATEAACRLIEKEGGTINIMKLVKLVYVLDRLSIARRGIPVVGGAYFSMPNGPITSELLDLVNSGCLWGAPECHWEDFVSDRQNHEVTLIKPATTEHLSEAELALIDEIYKEHGAKDQWQLREWCHEHCGEWTPLERGRDRIHVENMARAVGKSDEQIRRISEGARELNLLDAAFCLR